MSKSSPSAILRSASCDHVFMVRSPLRLQERFDGPTLVHRPVAFRDLIQR
jgi:hypothetical protein